ncbi:MAG: type IV pilus assembly protein PilB, type IV pilus assembly protein PilB [Microgenomates group bacterium GW2011_GWC1_37_8]|uniref:Type IV-A pilus assembly ATPase PilB n=1 Tax=Candidatus Woesebacteria bacterium GW2011_GWB1_38_8 TaxID=1618570 RepID=A0A0G0L1R2_9BACT|nr:MAG: type IV pilus assembly protein PilB, type IV pilus assembly protein PilB [Microgenomates group bacterium GW2011_GWC1_37_8]KKQ84937.1 MAG: Type IV-A pilus assembly ATPase PilB [Candidatus Woesebacteria bacterium GW2011_GWB1_38_8]
MVTVNNENLLNSLVELGVIPQDKLEGAYEESQTKKILFEEILLSENLITEADLGRVISDLTSIPFVRLSQEAIHDEVLKIIPEVVAKKQGIIAFKKDKVGLHVATNTPDKRNIFEFLEKKTGLPIIVYYATKHDIEDALTIYAKDLNQFFDEIMSENIQIAKGSKKPDPSIIKIIDAVITYAYQNKASDVHIEPLEDKSLIRFRIDGILHDIVELPKDLHSQIVTRVKVLAKLRTDEHQIPQDGKISFKLETETVDIRVSVVPVTNGEKVVMRILSERSRQFLLSDLGLLGGDLKKVEEAYIKPHGMVLATGPTGSGKTTTLYAILKLINKRDVNIMTIEDPVEYDIEGVNQIQVNEKTGLTFANGLRSIVRQDPDILLVGEIRDEVTADISINAAMTGHLVLSTLHTNNAATAIPRLLDMNIEPFLVASTVNVIIAQRLVRKICKKCRFSREVSLSREVVGDEPFRAVIKKYFLETADLRVYEGKGCEVCHNTGYVGRIGIFEVMLIDESIREAIIARKDASVIQELAIKAGMTTMLEDGIRKLKDGITTMEEILRVTKE